MIDKILKAAASMKKHKSHARHIFTFLEKRYGISVVFDDDSSSKKGGGDRKSSGTLGKLSQISKGSDIGEGVKPRGTNSCIVEKSIQPASQQKKSKPSPL